MRRRRFVEIGVTAATSSLVLAQSSSAPSSKAQDHEDVKLVPAGMDCLGEKHTLGFSNIAFKTSSTGTHGEMFVMEHSNLGRGGPFRHRHPQQDEWLYAMAGEFRVEIGEQKLTLKPGDSVLMPRNVPHVWAQIAETPGKLLIAFSPAGRMEEFFRDFGKVGKLPMDAEGVRAYGLERLGPPLSI